MRWLLIVIILLVSVACCDHRTGDMREGPIDQFLSIYGPKLNEATSVEFLGSSSFCAVNRRFDKQDG